MPNNDMANALRKPSGVDGLFGHGHSFLMVIQGKHPETPEKQEGADMGTRKIVLIRHGATKLNNKDVSVDRIRGWKDIPLSPDGQAEAERVGKKLKNGDMRPDILIPSDMERTRETAEIISKIADVPMGEPNKGFRPWNVGDLAGQVSKEAIPVLADYAENKPQEPLPGGESFDDFKGRFFNALHSTLQEHEGVVGIVTHHRDERLLKAWVKAGHDQQGDIDINEFNKKGEHTGSAEVMELPTANLESAAKSYQTSNPKMGKAPSVSEEDGE